MSREYGVACTVGQPKVNYKETIRQKAPFNYLHKKQSGGSGQFARVVSEAAGTPRRSSSFLPADC